jgi:hypothetical protein
VTNDDQAPSKINLIAPQIQEFTLPQASAQSRNH